MTPHEVLKKYWGYDSFRPRQEEIIASVLSGRDTLGLLPTGGGKSITFQVPAMILPGVTVVVTPLISLMTDQADNLARRGIRASLIHSGLSRHDRELAMTRCRLGKSKILYVSPERLQNDGFLSEMHGIDVSLLVIDEAHCISQWGYDFRPSYLRIADLRGRLPEGVPVLALTASATPEVQADIMDKLGMRDGQRFALSFDRPNLSYIVRRTEAKDEMLLRVLKATEGSAIVYVRSRRRTREIADMLAARGISAEAYHAGLASEDKEDRQNRWKRGQVRVMAATNAFGMGIDKPDVRVVVHYDLPPSLEEYYQEAGRAGRDGLHSYAVALAGRYDRGVLARRLSDAYPDKEFIREVYGLLGTFLGVAVGSGRGSLFEFSLEKFCQTFGLPPVQTESALRILTRSGYIEYIDETTTDSRVMVVVRRDELYSLRLEPLAEEVLEELLRRFTGLFADYMAISELVLARALGLSSQQVYDALLYLTRMHVIHYRPRRTTPFVYYPTSREETRHVLIPLAVYEEMRARMEKRIRAVSDFIFDDTACRTGRLLGYFGETAACACGRCDVCRTRAASRTQSIAEISRRIHSLASRPGGITPADICRHLALGADRVADILREMLEEGEVAYDPSTGKISRMEN
ncbi:MAG: RecQ family ATP-dependent DNA helicase [Duncaniella sp.]|nr:RecQ family ATP-dependent DNA helicase [Duncaniella sp.]